MGLIQQEFKISKGKDFETKIFKGKRMVTITQDNVAIAEAMIRNDSDYIHMSDSSFGKSAACYLSELREIYETEKRGEKTTQNVKAIIKNAVIALDNENSTHLNSDGVGRDEIPERIYKVYTEGRLFDLLKNPGQEYELFHIIEKKTHPKEKNKRARINTSFASKFCHYASFFVFEGRAEQDNYSIWDSILINMLPLYLDYYKIDSKEFKPNNKDYAKYQDIIKTILDKAEKESGTRISRNGFDHLIWYYYKGRMELYK